MSTPAGTDLIVVERSGTLYKETKTNWDSATGGGGGGGGGGSSSNGIVIKMFWGQITTGYNTSGTYKYGAGGTLYYTRADGAGNYTKDDTASSSTADNRPNTKIKVDGTTYSIGTQGTSTSATSQAGPCNAYYRRHVLSWAYSSTEMDTATGASSGTIQGIQVECATPANTGYNSFPNFGIALITYNVTNTSTNYSSQTFSTNNYGGTGTTYSWSSGFNTFNFTTNVSWSQHNGIKNNL